ncbi:MAG: outer membrane protein assembly factor BamC [Gammaproteobacteria bacterium]|nr:outer membrane protein assembly factor BamC [Gammaproteobacteria bacterium]
MKLFLISVLAVMLTACSTINNVFPDRSREYERAQTMPDLEIPPDLVSGGINESMSIPGEEDIAAPVQTQTATVTTTTANQATIETINNNNNLLAIPEEFTLAWVEVDKILQDAEIQINEQDRNTGIFNVTYSLEGGSQQRGLFTMIRSLDFSTSGDSQDYQVSLTGVGNKTELVILDMEGEWISDENSNSLLTTIRDHYNISRSQ